MQSTVCSISDILHQTVGNFPTRGHNCLFLSPSHVTCKWKWCSFIYFVIFHLATRSHWTNTYNVNNNKVILLANIKVGQETNVFTAVAEEGGDFVTIHFNQSMKAASKIKCSTVIFRTLVILPGQERGLTPIRPHQRLPPKPQPHCVSAQHRL